MQNAQSSDWQAQFWRQHPAFEVVADCAEALAWSDWPDAEPYYRQLSAAHLPIRFAEVSDVSYEQHIAATGAVPTRYANWHDYFNALIWNVFPNSKQALNDLHLLAKSGGSQRGSRRDAATLFDESGVVFACSYPALSDALMQMDWPTLFQTQRQQWHRQVKTLMFGHGALDKLRSPYIGLTAHALVIPVDAWLLQQPMPILRAEIDRKLSRIISEMTADWTPADLYPLPLLGIPGWWPENDNPEFYANEQYFRRQRRRQEKPTRQS